MQRALRLLVTGLLALTVATSLLFARGQFWDFLGDAEIDSNQDHGRIRISRPEVRFHTIQLRVTGEAIFFDRLVVHFEDGSSQELMVGERILPGFRDYELLGDHALSSVELWYYKQPGHNQKVTLYGIRSPQNEGQTLAQRR